MFALLKERQRVMAEQFVNLEQNFGGTAKHIFKNYHKNTKKSHYANRYSFETKQFVMTLHYYSPKAYDFVRRALNLPHPSSIQTWAASVDCEPGYLTNVITAVGQEAQTKSWMRDVVLLVDAMALHKMTIYDKAKNSFVGMVDYGTAITESETNEAAEALVFMIIGLTGIWKHPVAYVLQDKCTANVQSQMIKDCIGLLSEQGLQVHGPVFDGTFTNQQTAVKLGCKMNVSNPQLWFPHPQ